jgi:hypothetical protein
MELAKSRTILIKVLQSGTNILKSMCRNFRLERLAITSMSFSSSACCKGHFL